MSIDDFYEEGETGKFVPVVRNVEVRNLTTKKSQHALYLRGFKSAPLEQVRIVDCDFEGVAKPNVVENVRNLELKNVRINGKAATSF